MDLARGDPTYRTHIRLRKAHPARPERHPLVLGRETPAGRLNRCRQPPTSNPAFWLRYGPLNCAYRPVPPTPEA